MDPFAVQRPLFDWPRINPIAAGRRGYVPILLDRVGERLALEAAGPDVWERMTPLIQLELRPRGVVDPRLDAFRRAALRLAPALTGHYFYLDVMPSRRSGLAASGPVLALAHAEFRRRGLAFIPVYTVGNRSQTAIVAAAVEEDQRGVALRYRALEPLNVGLGTVPELLEAELGNLRVRADDADVVIDLRWVDPRLELEAAEVAEVLRSVSAVGPWRNTILAGTSIPDTLAGIPEGAVTPIERREWRLARELEAGFGLRPVYADYAVQHPRAPYSGSGGLLRANIRYATTASTFVARGVGEIPRLTPAERAEQYRGLCAAIIETPGLFAGPECCWGDRIIDDCVRDRLEPGAQNMWRAVGTSHHLRVVTGDLAELDGQAAPEATPVYGSPTRRRRVGRRAGRVPTEASDRLTAREP